MTLYFLKARQFNRQLSLTCDMKPLEAFFQPLFPQKCLNFGLKILSHLRLFIHLHSRLFGCNAHFAFTSTLFLCSTVTQCLRFFVYSRDHKSRKVRVQFVVHSTHAPLFGRFGEIWRRKCFESVFTTRRITIPRFDCEKLWT